MRPPPSEPYVRFSRIRLASRWVTAKRVGRLSPGQLSWRRARESCRTHWSSADGRGRRPTPKRVSRHSTDGRMLQASLYAAALMKRLPQLQIVGAAYLHLNERIEKANEAVLSSAALASPKTRSASLPLDPDEAVRKTIDFADRIRAGHLPLTDHDPTRAPDQVSHPVSGRGSRRESGSASAVRIHGVAVHRRSVTSAADGALFGWMSAPELLTPACGRRRCAGAGDPPPAL